MNAQSQLYRLPVYRPRWLSVFASVAAILASALVADAQRLKSPPFAFPPSSQVSLSAQVPNSLVGRSQERAIVKTISHKPSTKAQLNQALIAEAYRRNATHVAGLLAQGADPNASDKAGVPVLFYAVAVKGNMPVIMLLLSKGANVNARDPRGNTVLAEAVQLKADPVALLLQHKADPNVRNGAGFTPLGIATAESPLRSWAFSWHTKRTRTRRSAGA